MEAVEKKVIATLKAELVNEILFERVRSYRSDTPTFDKNCDVKFSVKAGNTVKEISGVIEYDYEDGNKVYTPTLNTSEFRDLVEAGIEIDFSEILESYTKAAALNKIEQAKDEEEAIRIKREKRGVAWDNSWLHDVEDIISNDKKLNALTIKVTHTTRDDFKKNGGNVSTYITYKNIVAHLTFNKYDDKYEFDGGYERAPTQEHPNNKTYISLTDGKTRKGKSLKGMIKRIIDHIDDYLAIRKSRKERKDNEKVTREAESLKITKLIDCEVIDKTEWKRDHYNRNRVGYDVWRKYAKIGDRTMSVGISVNTVYNSKTNERDYVDTTYTLGSISKLTEKQFVDMANILK